MLIQTANNMNDIINGHQILHITNKQCLFSFHRLSSDGYCDIESSLTLAYKLTLQTKKQRASIHLPRTIVFILNTSPQNKGSAKIAKTLRNIGAEIFLTTLGHTISDTRLRLLLSLPVNEHYMFVDGEADLNKTGSLIKNRGLL